MLSYIVLCLELQKKLIPNWIGYTGIPRLNGIFMALNHLSKTSIFLFTLKMFKQGDMHY